MNRALSILLVLFPGMLVAQSKLQPSQPSPTVHASLIPAKALPSPSEAPVKSARVLSTGLVRPKLVHTIPIVPPGQHARVTAKRLEVTVMYTVDATGTPTNPRVVESGNAFIDQEVLDAVAQFHYEPGLLDGEPTPFPMTLHYILDRGAEY